MRWSLSSAIAMALVILIAMIQKASSNAVFQLDLKSFLNKNGVNMEGHCCNGFKNSMGQCSDVCETKFRVCLNVYQQQINLESQCTFGEKITSVLGGNDVDFSRNDVMPLSFNLDSWQGTFSLIVEAMHEQDTNSTDFALEGQVLNRLMTQRYLSVGEGWTNEKHTNDYNSLEYRFRVVCTENYHGSQCKKWCRPRDDTFGHYSCDAEGNRVCLPGWEHTKQDSYCDKAICSPGCKGHCEKPNECKCHPGFQGPQCDQCKVYPGCEHGTCDSPWECNCEEGWGGLLCKQDLNFCTNHKPCKNGATCLNTGTPGSYTCLCPPGFNGTNCGIINDSCTDNPCQSGGTCLHTGDGGFVCQCPTSYSGRYCEVKNEMCSNRPCLNSARCTDGPTGFQCHCPPGFRGSKCEQPICRNGGSYVESVGHYKCQCQAGFVGRFCEINVDDCQAKPCGNGGTCVDGVNTVQCLCRPGWAGKFCNEKISPCQNNPCENGGMCSPAGDLSSGYRCSCPHGYLGPRCSIVQDYAKQEAQGMAEPMSPVKIVLIVTFSVAVPILALGFFIAIRCMKRRRQREMDKSDEEARRQNEQNAVHNAINNKNFADKMIFNSLEYPSKPLNTEPYPVISDPKGSSSYCKAENAYTIVPARSTKTLNTDVSRLSLASKLEKDLDAYTMSRNSPCSQINCKTPDPHLARTHSHGDVFSKRPASCTNSNINTNSACNDVCTSTNTLTSACTPSTCTTPSSVYVIDEHYDQENYIATEV